MARIGVQAMMLKGFVAEEGPYAAMEKLVSTGFRVTEVSQIPMTADNVAELRRARDELGVEFAAISASVGARLGGNDSLSTDLDKIVADAAALGAPRVRLAMMPIRATRDADALRGFGAELEVFCRRLADAGIGLCYHNHHLEFARFDGRYVLDILSEAAPSVGLELDVHWLQRGGLDPRTAILEREGRVRLLHLKDYRVEPLPLSAVEAMEAGDTAAFFRAFSEAVMDAEVGEGNLDWRGIIDAALEVGVEALLVEQEQTEGRDILECLRTSHRNLVALGYGELI